MKTAASSASTASSATRRTCGRQMLGAAFKAYARSRYEVYHGVADLYAYFFELGVAVLKEGGQFSIIVANKWMRANYGAPLRKWLREQGLELIVDFGDLPVFPEATAYPCIVRLRKGSKRKSFTACNVQRLADLDLDELVRTEGTEVAFSSLTDSGWTLTGGAEQRLLEKLRKTGTPLGEYVGGKIYYGIKTGLNEAFVIDAATRERLIARGSEERGDHQAVPPRPGRQAVSESRAPEDT